MTKQTEAMKQALEALEIEQGAHAYLQLGKAEHIEKAITALRQALANEALDRMAENARELGLDYTGNGTAGREADVKPTGFFFQTPDQPVQEEAQQWAVFCAGCRKEWSVTYQHPGKSVCAECEAKLTAQQEPVAWRNAAIRVGEDLCSVGPFGYYDMTAEQWLDWALGVVTVHEPLHPQAREPEQPAQRTWVGLTDEEVFDVWLNEMPAPDKVFYQKLCRSVEAKLREKNT